MSRFSLSLPAFALIALAAAPAAPAEVPPADAVFVHARIYTADATRTQASALAIRDGRIVYVGDEQGARAYRGAHTAVHDLNGRRVLPGLYDVHVHATGIVDLDVCDLRSAKRTLKEISAFVRGCISRYHIPEGEWVYVRQWNITDGNEPDAEHPTLRAALDRATTRHPVELLGNDGHHSAFNSAGLARAKNAAGEVVGYSRSTLAKDFEEFRKLVGVDAAGEPSGAVNDEARAPTGAADLISVDFAEVAKAPERVTARLNSVGITGILDPLVTPQMLPFYDELESKGKLSVRATLAQYYVPERELGADGKPDWDRMVATARGIRAKYEHDPLLRADIVKLFADGIQEGNPRAVPPTLPEVAVFHPYLQPIFKTGPDHRLAVVGYVDTQAPYCVEAREHPERYESAASVDAFVAAHGAYPSQCAVSTGQLTHEREVELEFARRFHMAGFGLHIHAIGEVGVRTAVDAIEAARAADGVSGTHDALAHVQVADPQDVARIGRDKLYLALTYSWANSDPEYDLSVVPFFDHVLGGDEAALHPANGYYEQRVYPFRALKDAGATLAAGSDAPVNTRDPQPFVNMATAVTRRIPGHPAITPGQCLAIRDVVDAYTINGARYVARDSVAGSLEAGKSADFIVLDRDILALADQGRADDIAGTRVLETWFMGARVYQRGAAKPARGSP